MSQLIVYSDYVCPFCYLAEGALSRLRDEEDVEVTYRAYELRPRPLPQLDPNDAGLHRAWDEVIVPLARELDIEIRRPPIQPRTRKAHEAVAFAHDHGRGLSMHRSVFRAHFVEGRDVGRIDVLVELGEGVGLDRTALKIALDIDQLTERVSAEQAAAREHGIRGVPSFLVDDRIQMGLQSYPALRALVRGDTDESTS